MKDLKYMISTREQELLKLINDRRKALVNAPEYKLKASLNKGRSQFYSYLPGHSSEAHYIKAKDELIDRLAQKEYDEKILRAAERELKLIRKLHRFYQADAAAETQYERLHKEKQKHVRPVRDPDRVFTRKWLDMPCNKPDFQEGGTYYLTDNEEKVCSKSEVIIANLLLQTGVPYRYECPLLLNDISSDYADPMKKKRVYPDFTILRVSDRTELIWEHLGLLDNADYVKKNLMKIRLYELNGYFPGQRLINTYETSNIPLNREILENVIRTRCR